MFQLGDKVKGLNEALEGVVTHVDGNLITVEVNGFEYPIHSSELLKIETDDRISFSPKQFHLPKESFKTNPDLDNQSSLPPIKLTKRNRRGVLEVDLHFSEILSIYPSLSKENALETQLFHAERCVEEVKRRNEKRLVLIHGRGKGRLELELRNRLNGRNGVWVEDAPMQWYGRGAIEVFLK